MAKNEFGVSDITELDRLKERLDKLIKTIDDLKQRVRTLEYANRDRLEEEARAYLFTNAHSNND